MPSYDGRPTIRGCGLLPRPRPKPTFSRRCGRCRRPWSQTGSPSTVAWTSPSTATAPAAGRGHAVPAPLWGVAGTPISSRARNPDDAADRARPVCRGLRRHLPSAGVSTLVLDVRRPTLGGGRHSWATVPGSRGAVRQRRRRGVNATRDLLSGLERVRPITGGWMARCPAHDDDTASLSVSEGDDGRALIFCHAGCATEAILAAMRLPASSLFPPRQSPARGRVVACYDYCDERGEVLYQCVRLAPKAFFQRRRNQDGTWTNKLGNVRRVLNRLPELRGPVAYVVEGEKDANALMALGLVATSNMGGAGKGKWKAAYGEQLRAAGISHVVVIPDNDAPGQAHARVVAASCHAAGMAVKLVALPGVPDKGDVSDWLAQGRTKADLVAAVKDTPTWAPDQAPVPPPVVAASAPIAAACFNLTDLGAAEFFADRYGHQMRYDHRRRRWLIWRGHRWVPDADGLVYRLASEHLRRWQRDAMEIPDREKRQRVAEFALRLQRRGGLENLVTIAQSRRPITTDGKDWDTNRDTLGVANGVVDLLTGCHRPGAPADLITMSTNCAYDPHAESPAWDRFLEAVLPDADVRTFLQRFVGYALTGNTDEQVLAMLYGKGSNGKSTLLSVLADVLGDYATTIAFSALEMKRSDIPSDIAGLQNLRFVMASEIKEGQRFNEARIKALTGGDVISARHLYGRSEER